jgi:hypothetical protein
MGGEDSEVEPDSDQILKRGEKTEGRENAYQKLAKGSTEPESRPSLAKGESIIAALDRPSWRGPSQRTEAPARRGERTDQQGNAEEKE